MARTCDPWRRRGWRVGAWAAAVFVVLALGMGLWQIFQWHRWDAVGATDAGHRQLKPAWLQGAPSSLAWALGGDWRRATRLELQGAGAQSLHGQEMLRILIWDSDAGMSLGAIEGHAHLECVMLAGHGGNVDLRPLATLDTLKSLDLSGPITRDLRPLKELDGVLQLGVWGVGGSDLAPIGGMTGLQGLHWVRMPPACLEPLLGLPRLECLNLTDTPVLDMQPLTQMTQLRHLSLSGTGVSPAQLAALRAALPDCEIAGP